MALPFKRVRCSGGFMISQQVEAILQQIERLNEADRTALEQRLQEIAEIQWQREAEDARASARERGVDQQMIDDAVEHLRYPSLSDC